MKQNEIATIADLDRLKNEIVLAITSSIETQIKPKKWLKSTDVREILQVSPATLQTLRINGTLPFTKIGKTFYYDFNEIMRIMEENKSN